MSDPSVTAGSEEARYRAALEGPRDAEALLAALGDPSWRVRKAASERLGRDFSLDEVGARLVTALADGENAGLRSAALETLAARGPAAAGLLAGAARSPDADLRKLAVDALGQVRAAETTEVLVGAVRDGDPNVRIAAVEALGKVGGAGATAELLRVAKGREWALRLAALDALAREGAELPFDLVAPALEDAYLRRVAARALAACRDPRAWDALLELACDRAHGTREAAFAAIASHARRAGVGAAWPSISGRRHELALRAREHAGGDSPAVAGALVVLSLLGDPANAPLLAAQADRDELRDVASAGLERLGSAAIPALVAALPELTAAGRSLALEAVGAATAAAGADRAELRDAEAAALRWSQAGEEEEVENAAAALLRSLRGADGPAPRRGRAGGNPIAMSPGEFSLLRDLLCEHCGILFRDEMAYLMERRLRPRLAERSLSSFESYHAFLRSDPDRAREMDAAIEALTTNETYFFREPNQLRAFSEEVVPAIASTKSDKRLRVWSAGCSTGEECYTLAILLLQSVWLRGWEIEIVGTDISRKVLAAAERAEYGPSSLRATSEEMRRAYFRRIGARYVPRDDVRFAVSFVRHNLMDRAPSGQPPVDVIFCRNVMIYFDIKARRRVLESFWRRLAPGGYLFLGHSESLLNVTADFELVHLRYDVAYRKPAESAAGVPP